MALPCVHGGMGIIGYKNHLKTNPEDHKTLYVKYHVKLGFLSGLSTKNHHQNLSPFCRHSHFSGMGAQPPTEFEDYAFRRHKSQMFQPLRWRNCTLPGTFGWSEAYRSRPYGCGATQQSTGDGDEPGEEDPNSSSNAFGGYIFY
ncbi:uncharacterized protein LOC132300464 isoform X3 [Cornus florida]|uniref:uncharacterized protein LOC132300464 isoform X3 n=1 Tax=Cornus florida TaxID=4283 RepID=UPI0028975FF2|nr:uncharacterized protein LOC132300464 isoform X3 [Cornus florida]